MEKYDFPSIADKIQNVYSNLEKLNNNLKENVALLNKGNGMPYRHNIDQENKLAKSKEKILEAEKEVSSLRASEKLLFESANEKDRTIYALANDKEKHIKLLNEMNKNTQELQVKINKL